MGSGKDKQTVGYFYYAGMHMILCHGPIDMIRKMFVDDKEIYTGFSSNNQIVYINKPGLFGGESREGGVSGFLEIELGEDDQLKNNYLARQLVPTQQDSIPAFRGVVGVVLRQMYLGLNPYLKKWSFKAQRVFTRQGGVEQWQSAIAPIIYVGEPIALYFALDFSGSMTGTKYDNQKLAMFDVLNALDAAIAFESTAQIDIMVVGFGGLPGLPDAKSSILRRDIDSADIAAIKAWYPTINPEYGTDFRVGVDDSISFFSGSLASALRFSFFLTDGEPADSAGTPPLTIAQQASTTLFSNDDLTAFAFNIELTDTTYTDYMDNTIEDGVPVLDATNLSLLTTTVLSAISGQIDLNGVHIIRECLTDTNWGLGYPESEIDSTSFETAANTLFNEHMGLSLLWENQTSLEDFISDILRHIDAVLYVSRTTGKFVIKLIRNDYTVGSLTTFDKDNASKITDFSKPAIGELANSITVNHFDYKTGVKASVTVQDPALIQMQAGVINTTISYPGFSNTEVANRVAVRDLKALSSPLVTCTIETGQAGKDYNIGDVFILNWPEYGIDSFVMRITSLSFGNGVNNRIRITATQDKFDFENVSLVNENVDEWVPPGGPPLPIDYQVTEEATYWALIKQFTQSIVDDELTLSPTTGYIAVAGVRPLNGLSGRLYTDSGAGYEDASPLEFCPTATLAEAADYLTEFLEVENDVDLEFVTVGTYAQIGNELVGILDVNLTTNIIQFERAILDTLPAQHAIGARVFFWDLYGVSDGIAYVDPEVIGAKILTITSQGELDIADAVEETVTMDSRAIRPYPPGNIKINSSLYPTQITGLVDITVTWAHRDRTQQTAEFVSFTDTSIGPEVSTTYTLEFYNEDGVLSKTYTGLTGTSQIWDTEIADSGLGRYNEQVRVRLYSVRDSYNCFQVFDLTFLRVAKPVNITPPVVTIIPQ